MKSRIYAKNISYIISISIGKGCYRHLRISGNKTLHDLADTILWAFEFDHDHLYAFFMDDKWWSRRNVYHSPYDDTPPFADEIKLTKLRLFKGQSFKFLFDFGDEWRFQCKVLRVLDETTKESEIVRMKGEPPEQYPVFDEDFDYDEYNKPEESYPPITMTARKQCTPSIVQSANLTPPPEKTEKADIDDAVFEAAFQYRSDKLWSKLNDTDIFAVCLSNGEIGYCSVTGSLGECIALGLYIGDEGLWSLYQIFQNAFENSFATVISQNCLRLELTDKSEIPAPIVNAAKAYGDAHTIKFNGKKRYPTFLKMQSYLVPDYIKTKEDFRLLAEALRAAHEVAGKLKTVSKTKLGLDDTLNVIPLLTPNGNGYKWSLMKKPDAPEFPYARPVISEEKAAALRALPQKGKWESCIYILSDSVRDEHVDRDVFQPLLLTAGVPSKLEKAILGNGYYPEIVGEMLSQLADWMLECGVRPKMIVTHGARSLSFLAKFCEVCEIALTSADKLGKVEKMLDDYRREHNMMDNEMLSEIADMLVILEQMESEEIEALPDELKAILCSLIGQGLLSGKLEKRLAKML